MLLPLFSNAFSVLRNYYSIHNDLIIKHLSLLYTVRFLFIKVVSKSYIILCFMIIKSICFCILKTIIFNNLICAKFDILFFSQISET